MLTPLIAMGTVGIPVIFFTQVSSLKPKSGLKPASPSIIFLEQHSYEEPSSLFIIFPSENGDAIIGKRHKIDRVVFWERQQLIFFHKGMAFFRALLTTVKIN